MAEQVTVTTDGFAQISPERATQLRNELRESHVLPESAWWRTAVGPGSGSPAFDSVHAAGGAR